MTAVSKNSRIAQALGALFAGLALLAPAPASATTFGTEQVLRHLQDVTIKNASGDSLYLGYKVSFHWFLVPYAVSNDGYVLAAKDKQIFYPADQAKLEQWQAQGHLPTPLPSGNLSIADYLFGHLLWIVLAAACLWNVCSLVYYRRARTAAAKTAAAAKVVPFKPKPAATPVLAVAMRAPPPAPAPAATPAVTTQPERRPDPVKFPPPPSAAPAAPAPAAPPATTEPAKLGVAKTVCRVKQLKVA